MRAITTSNSMRVKARQGYRRTDWLRTPAQRFASRGCVFINRAMVQGSVIVGLGCYFSSSDGPLSREQDPLFGSQLPKLPIRIGRREPRGRMEHLAGLGWARWRFKADAHARFVERMRARAPGPPGEPQSTGGEQRRYCQEQIFCFHCFCFLIQVFTFTFTTALCADFWKLAFDLERRRGILVRSASDQE